MNYGVFVIYKFLIISKKNKNIFLYAVDNDVYTICKIRRNCILDCVLLNSQRDFKTVFITRRCTFGGQLLIELYILE